MKKITFIILALSVSTLSFGQITIKGKVQNDSIPLESASIAIKNSQKGTITNMIGEFKIEAKKGDTLSISYIGYKTKDIVVNQDEIFRIKLEEGGNLDEVVVNAYGIARKVTCGVCYCVTKCGIYSEEVLESKEIFEADALKLYPNPSSNGIFQLMFVEDYNDVKISIANMSGQTIQNSTHQKFGEKLSVDLSEHSAGIYIINIVADGKRLKAVKAIKS
ncbi:carboxypeptidase-like regulatory domain-containing protein [Winogradskyella echinorum]|uniref:Carboxypeptidase-like regulatory domain-containing protein n=1 Tax=Winogradskyella echinorum TaxID=538189 RepID=A0ABR6Y3Y3_9FLAO|nr:carboxypeptidase-like regulatory domain-containing protein [Winogradskyella echinorum]MBC3847465.1 carboxypeptidase-like regulatory domain-containing protein [Winogradskyella echinorum]MBC5751813.1 carboxypeptidase-like regulatory domain-containing protein [Winogradskyella echinorum]